MRWSWMAAPRKLDPNILTRGINQGQYLAWIDPLESNCLGSAIWSDLTWPPRRSCHQCRNWLRSIFWASITSEPSSKVTADFRFQSEITGSEGAWGIDLSQFYALIHPLDQFLRDVLPWTRHLRLNYILESQLKMLAVPRWHEMADWRLLQPEGLIWANFMPWSMSWGNLLGSNCRGSTIPGHLIFWRGNNSCAAELQGVHRGFKFDIYGNVQPMQKTTHKTCVSLIVL